MGAIPGGVHLVIAFEWRPAARMLRDRGPVTRSGDGARVQRGMQILYNRGVTERNSRKSRPQWFQWTVIAPLFAFVTLTDNLDGGRHGTAALWFNFCIFAILAAPFFFVSPMAGLAIMAFIPLRFAACVALSYLLRQ